MKQPFSRRRLLALALAAGGAATLGAPLATQADGARGRSVPTRRRAPRRILILGGTGFLGPACIAAAHARGHRITIFNRGRTEQVRKERGRPLDLPDGVEVIYGNRDPEKTADDWKDPARGQERRPDSPKGLSGLVGREWDAVIDTSGYFPRMVRASATLLAPSVGQYVFISSVSAYARIDRDGVDETAPLATLPDPAVEDFGPQFANYGGGKAMCEKAAEEAMPGRTTIIRPGFIVGPGDTSARFIYWPLRVERGGEMAVPGSPTDPIQLIDVRDLAEWIVRLIEARVTGAFNATGPAEPLTFRAMLEGCRRAAGADTRFTWIDADFLRTMGVEPEEHFPLWVSPAAGEQRGIHRISIRRALDAGLAFRPLDQTARATLDWHHSLPDDAQAAVGRARLAPQREAEVLEAWRSRR